MKSIKIRYDKIKKENIDYSILDEAVKNVNRLIHTNYLFMRSFLIYSFENNYDDMDIDVKFIRLGFRIVTGACFIEKAKGRPVGKDRTDILTKMKKYWPIFSKKTNIKPIICHNISYIYNNSASEIYTNIINNLLGNFQKHIHKCIKCHYSINHCKPNKVFSLIIKETSKAIIDKSLSSIKKKSESHRKMIINAVKLFYDKFLPNDYYKKSLASSIKTSTYQYLKSSYKMIKYIEDSVNKLYQFFPIKTSIYDKHITINTNALIDLFVNKDKLKALQKVGDNGFKKIVWNTYFRLWDKNNKLLYKFNNYVFNNEIQINGYSVSLNFIHKDGLDGQKEKNKLRANGRKESYKKKQEMTNEEYNIYKKGKINTKIDKDVQYSTQCNEKLKKLKRTFKKLSDDDKFKKIYELNLKKDYPKIEYLIKGSSAFSKELKEKYKQNKFVFS